MMIDQLRAPGGRTPSCGSVACPENVIVSPTFQVSDRGAGVRTVAVGGALPAVMVIGRADVGASALVGDLEARREGASRGVGEGRLRRRSSRRTGRRRRGPRRR